MTATAQGEAARDAVAFRGTTPVIDGPLMGHERCHVETLRGFSWDAMRLLTISHAQFAENHLVHKADQIRNCHVEEFMCSRCASKA